MVATLRNISPYPIQLSESLLTYELAVLDESGRPALLTDYGKQIASAQDDARNGRMRPFPGQARSFDLRPGHVITSLLGLRGNYDFKAWEDYTIHVKYAHDMPKFDGGGKVVLQRELIYTLHAKGGVMAP
jgi:hypothetical protein